LATEVRLPQFGKTMCEAVVVEYRVGLGEQVKKGDCIYDIETDKATLEVESPAEGFVKCFLAEIGQTIRVGQPVLILAEKDEQLPQSLVDSLKSTLTAGESTTASQTPKSAVRAAEILEPDLTPVPTEPPQQFKLGQTVPLTPKQKITAQRMLQSKREKPCFYLNVRADVTDLVELRNRLNKTSDVRISYNDFIIRSVALALEKFPIMTGRLKGQTIKLADSIDIALAVTVPDGLVAPVIRNINKKTVTQIAKDTKVLIDRTLANKLVPADLQGACITVSNLGSSGVDSFIPIVVPGQCSILGVGKITEVCLPADDSLDSLAAGAGIVVRKLLCLTLSADHRIANGNYAAQFLDFVKKLLEETSNFT